MSRIREGRRTGRKRRAGTVESEEEGGGPAGCEAECQRQRGRQEKGPETRIEVGQTAKQAKGS